MGIHVCRRTTRSAVRRKSANGKDGVMCVKTVRSVRRRSQSEKAPQPQTSSSSSSAQSAAQSLASNIFTRSGNEALGYMEEDSAGQSNIFAFEPSKPYVSSKGGSLGTVAGGFFAVITIVTTLAVGYAGGTLYKQSKEDTTKTMLMPLSYYAALYESELKASEPIIVPEPVFEVAVTAPEIEEVAPVLVEEQEVVIEEVAPAPAPALEFSAAE